MGNKIQNAKNQAKKDVLIKFHHTNNWVVFEYRKQVFSCTFDLWGEVFLGQLCIGKLANL